MASQSFNLIGQEEEQELVAFGTRQSRGPTPLSCPNSIIEEMLSQLIISQAEANKSLEAKVSELANSQSELHTSIDEQLADIAYKQIEQIAEMSTLVDRMSIVERSLQGSPYTGSDPTRRSPTPPGHALMAGAPYPPVLATPSSLALERSKEEVGFRTLKVLGRPVDKGSVNTTQGQGWSVLEVG